MTPGEQGRQYDLNRIYKDVFGHIRPPYPTIIKDGGGLGINPLGSVKALRGAFNFSGSMGVEYSMPTKIAGYQLPNEPSVRVTGGKNIIETKLTRLDPLGQLNKANVLEEINMNNYRIRITGVIINEQDDTAYPEEAMWQIRDICTRAGSVSIENFLCNLWGIGQIAIEDFDFEDVKGAISVQKYSIIGYSDEFVDLEVVERVPATAQTSTITNDSPELAGTL